MSVLVFYFADQGRIHRLEASEKSCSDKELKLSDLVIKKSRGKPLNEPLPEMTSDIQGRARQGYELEIFQRTISLF